LVLYKQFVSHNICGYGAASQVSGHNGFDILTYTSNYVGIHLYGTAIIAGGTYNLNSWNHYVITYDGTTLQGYLNGVAVDSNNTEVVNTLSTNDFIIGEGVYSGFNGFSGKLDGISIFDYALSASQVTTLYGSSSTGIGNPMSLSPKPVAYYPLGDQDAFNGASYLTPNASLKDFVFDFIPNDYIDLPSNSTTEPTTAFSLSLWAKWDVLSGIEGLISNGQNRGYMIWSRNNAVTFYLYQASTGSFAQVTSSVTLTINTWFNIVATWDGSNVINIYVNGNPTGTQTGVTTPLYSNNPVIGQYAGNYFNGKLSNVQIFNTALPATGSNSVETLYNNGSPLTSMSGFSSLQGWWKLDASATYNGTNWTIPDDSTNSNDGTSSGMTQANLVQSDLSFTSGYSPYALDFDSASSDYIDCGDSDSLSFGNGTTDSPFSVSTWVNFSDVTNSSLFSKSEASEQKEYTAHINSEKIYFGLYSELGSNYMFRYYDTALTSFQGSWVHFVFTYDGSKSVNGLKIYLNNTRVDDQSLTSGTYVAMNNGTAPFKIGRSFNNRYLDGKISNASIWDTDLTSAQVTEIYSEGIPQNLNNHSAVVQT